MISNVFSRIISGTKHETILKIKMLGEHAYKFSPTYKYIEVPVASVSSIGLMTDVLAACEIDPQVYHGYTYMIEPNPKLGLGQGVYLLHGGEGKHQIKYSVVNSETNLKELLDLNVADEVDLKSKKKVKPLHEDDRWAVRIYIVQ